jgi:sulfur carrier protein ThiS
MTKIKAYIERDDKNVEISLSNPTIKSLLEHLKINPVEVIVTKNNEVCIDEEKISQKDKIKIISVVSGG